MHVGGRRGGCRARGTNPRPEGFQRRKAAFRDLRPIDDHGVSGAAAAQVLSVHGQERSACPLQISNFSVPGAPMAHARLDRFRPVKDAPAKWEAIRSPRYIDTVQKLIKDNPGTPVIVLAMNCTGLRDRRRWRARVHQDTRANDSEHINLAKNFLRTHIHAILDDGAAMYFLSPKKYWRALDDPHEWNRNEETFAVAKVAEENIPGFVYVKGVWEDTAKYKAIALLADGHHPTQLGDEIIAGRFFPALLEHDGLPVPPWDQEEVDTVRKAFETKGAQGNVEPWKP